MGRKAAFVAGASFIGLVAGQAHASETTTYTYDALNRLIATSRTGGPNDAVQTATAFDPAGNRTTYSVAGGASSPPLLSIGNASATEGGNLVFTVTRSGNTAAAVSVNYATANGTATSGSDYTATSGTLNFAAGQTTAIITVATIDDAVYESTEAMTVTLSSPTGGATIGTATGTGTITDNDPAPSTLSIGNASATEGGNLVFTMTRTGSSASAVTAHYATANGTAVSGSDYTAASGTVSLAAGQTTATITVPTIDDAIPEATETMMLGLSSPTGGASIGTATGTGTITDNDANATLAIGNASATEGQNLVFTVTRSGNTGFAVSVNYATANGTATAGSDYNATSGTLNFAVGQTTATITVPTIDDTTTEPTETLSVTLSSPSSGASISTATGNGSIIDNDAVWSSTLTAGSQTTCLGSGATKRCTTTSGYVPPLGSMSTTSYNSYTIATLDLVGTALHLSMMGSSAPPNSGWSTITVPGIGTLNRTSATYSSTATSGTWLWSATGVIASGTVTVQ